MFDFIFNWLANRKAKKEARRIAGIEQQVEHEAFIAEKIRLAKERGKALAQKT